MTRPFGNSTDDMLKAIVTVTNVGQMYILAGTSGLLYYQGITPTMNVVFDCALLSRRNSTNGIECYKITNFLRN